MKGSVHLALVCRHHIYTTRRYLSHENFLNITESNNRKIVTGKHESHIPTYQHRTDNKARG